MKLELTKSELGELDRIIRAVSEAHGVNRHGRLPINYSPPYPREGSYLDDLRKKIREVYDNEVGSSDE